MKNEKSVNVYNLLIIDESGSMSSIYRETLSSINETLNGIRKAQKEFPNQNQFVSIVTFEGYGPKGVKTRRDRVPVLKVKDMTKKDYQPGGGTPLYDAMGTAINHLDASVNDGDAVLVTVITDGYENASEEYSGRAIRNLVERQKEKGWTFAYIGANQDAIMVANDMSIDNALNFRATSEGTRKMAGLFNRARRKYLGKVNECMDMSCEEREAYLGSVMDLFDE